MLRNQSSIDNNSSFDDNINNISFEEIRDYLYETNAIQEAETTFLKNILEGNNNKRKKPSSQNNNNNNNNEIIPDSNTRTDWINNMKVTIRS